MHLRRLGVLALVAALVASTMASASAAQSQSEKPAPAASKPATVVNVNTATVAELESLPGIGPRTAERILEYRQKHGSFKKIEELMNVRGIGEKSFLKLKPLITVAPARPGRPAASSSR